MNCSPTITADEFKTIHNAVCNLDSICSQLEDILKPELYVKLVKARNDIRKGLEGAYEQDHSAFDRKHNHYDQVRTELGLSATWSIFEVDNLSEPHPYQGAVRVVYKDHWGSKPVECQVTGTTWAALYVAANACIRNSGDEHHVFIEQFRPSKDNTQTLILSTGS